MPSLRWPSFRFSRLVPALGTVLLGVLTAACGGSSAHPGSSAAGSGGGHTGAGGAGGAGGGAGGSGGGPAFPEATHPPLPQVKNMGGPVCASPAIVAVTFPGDPDVMQIDDFAGKLGATSYFADGLKEYGVGPAKLRSAVHLTSNPFPGTVDDAQLQPWLVQQIGNALPAADGSTIYVIFFLDTQIVTHQGSVSCQQFAGYHGEAPLTGAASAPYAVVARCPTAIPSVTGLDQVTGTASHEIAEAATNPYPVTKPAYLELDTLDFGWEIGVGGGEIADMCAQAPDAYVTPPGFPYVVQRVWSNAAAAAGHDPCRPKQAGPYFNSGAVMPDMIPISLVVNGAPQEVSVRGVQIPVGSSKSIELDLFSDEPTSGPWSVSASDFTTPPAMPVLGFSFDKTMGQNGDKIHLTIAPMQASFTGTESFVIESQLGSAKNTWVGLVGN